MWLGYRVLEKEGKRQRQVGKGSWDQTIKYLDVVHRLSCSMGNPILGFSGKMMTLDMCLGKSSLVAMGRSEWRGETEAKITQKEQHGGFSREEMKRLALGSSDREEGLEWRGLGRVHGANVDSRITFGLQPWVNEKMVWAETGSLGGGAHPG